MQDRRPPNCLAGIVDVMFSKYAVTVEDGRLIQNVPLCYSEAVQNLSWYQQAEYRCAFEADVTNLLAGSLAEANYIARRDGEAFTANLVNLDAIRFYIDSSGIELINHYMHSYLPDKTEREQKLKELSLAAFRFVDDNHHWQKISNLAEYIQRQTKVGVIHCEEAIALLESGMPLGKIPSLDLQTLEYG